jgi:acyl-CoA synthetase (NDP forming)
LPEFWEKYRHESVSNTPLFRNPEDPVEVLSNLRLYSNKNSGEIRLHPGKNLLRNTHGFLSQSELEDILTEYKIPIVSSVLVTPEEINNITEIKFPVCLKGISEKVIHKSELNAVKLNIINYEQLLKSAVDIENSFNSSGFHVEKFLIQPFLKVKYELLVGGFRDVSFGPIIMFGSGGKYVEILQDTSIKSAYLCENDIDNLINSTKAGSIINGVRGDKASDISIIKSIIRNCAQMMLDCKNISEFDLNPVIITDDNLILTVDSRIKCV